MPRRAPPPPGPTVNITSLCDIMLSLLIFFMLVSKTGVDTGADPELELPTAVLGITEADLEAEQAAGNSLVVNVQPGTSVGRPTVYGKLFSTGDAWEFTVDTARGDFTDFMQDVRGDREDFEVSIHAEGGTDMVDIEPVMRAVNQVRPSQVNYAYSPS